MFESFGMCRNDIGKEKVQTSLDYTTQIEKQSYGDLLIVLFITGKIQMTDLKMLLYSFSRAVSRSKV